MDTKTAERILRNAGILTGVSPGQKLYAVGVGDIVKVNASVKYKGPQLDDTFYAAIGIWRGVTWPIDIGYFDEIWHNESPVRFLASDDWDTYNLEVDIPITEVGLFPWTPGWFDLYAKIDGQGIYASRYHDVIEVLLKPQFQEFAVTSYDKISGE